MCSPDWKIPGYYARKMDSTVIALKNKMPGEVNRVDESRVIQNVPHCKLAEVALVGATTLSVSEQEVRVSYTLHIFYSTTKSRSVGPKQSANSRPPSRHKHGSNP